MPQRWDRVYSAFDEVEEQLHLVQGQECISLKAGAKADTNWFSKDEKAVVDEVCEKFKDMTSRTISNLSHKEKAWKENVGKTDTIPFCEAFSLEGI